MSNELTKTDLDPTALEAVLIGGDLSKLTAPQRVQYYKKVCESVGLNPLTKPFEYIQLNGKLTLYAKKDCTDQLRDIKSVSIDDVDLSEVGDNYVVKVKGHDKTGRSDVEIGIVSKKDMQGNAANAQMKAVTKAKRRLTLSLCGLGWLDETEVETIPTAKPVIISQDTGEIVEGHAETITNQVPAQSLQGVNVSKPTSAAMPRKTETLPAQEPSQAPWTYEEACAKITSKGARYDTLTEDQLKFLVDAPKATVDSKQAAKIILRTKFHIEYNGPDDYVILQKLADIVRGSNTLMDDPDMSVDPSDNGFFGAK